MSDRKRPDRRSFLRRVVGGAAALGALGTVTGHASAQSRRTGLTDSDESDAANFGTQTGYNDSDSGSNSDPIGRGRRRTTPQRCSDSDTGRNADPVGRGRRCGTPVDPKQTSCSDSDSGRNGDASGSGRRCGPNAPTPGPCSDSDTGRSADAVGRGRRCRAG
jgi:hypothetical protein